MHQAMGGGVWTGQCSNRGEFLPKSAMFLFITRKYKLFVKVLAQASPDLRSPDLSSAT